jgi:hypothetical protein
MKLRFLNQKLGKNVSRRAELQRAKVESSRQQKLRKWGGKQPGK